MSFIEELKRRKVFRVAASYAVASFVIMQLVEILFPMFNFPQWTQQFIVIVVLLGFPIAVILSWVFDKTPEGLIRTTSTAEVAELAEKNISLETVSDSRPFYLKKRNIFLVAGILLGGAITWMVPRGGGDDGGTDHIQKLAILPFTNIRPDPESDFLGFALSDEIIARLGYVQSLVVRPATAVRRYRDNQVAPAEVGKELDVGLILTGSYLRDKDRLRLNTELMDIHNNERLWAKSITVDYSDIFALQDSISSYIVAGLKTHLEPEDYATGDVPNDPVAYEYYLRAISSLTMTIKNLELRQQLLEEAAKRDEQFAPTWAELAWTYTRLAQVSPDPAGFFDTGLEALAKALKVNANSLRSLQTASYLYAESGRAEESFESARKALEIAPNDPANLYFMSYPLRYAGLLDESLAYLDRSVALEGGDAYEMQDNYLSIGKAHLYSGDYVSSAVAMERAKRIAEGSEFGVEPYTIFYNGLPGVYSGDYESAFEAFQQSVALETRNTWTLFGLTYRALVERDYFQARKHIEELENRNITDSEIRYRFVHFYALLGETGRALDKLQETVDGGFFCYPYIVADPLTKNIHGEPRFKQILQEVKQRHEAFKRRFASDLAKVS